MLIGRIDNRHQEIKETDKIATHRTNNVQNLIHFMCISIQNVQFSQLGLKVNRARHCFTMFIIENKRTY